MKEHVNDENEYSENGALSGRYQQEHEVPNPQKAEAAEIINQFEQALTTPRRERKGRTNRKTRAATQLEKVPQNDEPSGQDLMQEIKLLSDNITQMTNERSRSQKRDNADIDLLASNTISRTLTTLETIKQRLEKQQNQTSSYLKLHQAYK